MGNVNADVFWYSLNPERPTSFPPSSDFFVFSDKNILKPFLVFGFWLGNGYGRHAQLSHTRTFMVGGRRHRPLVNNSLPLPRPIACETERSRLASVPPATTHTSTKHNHALPPPHATNGKRTLKPAISPRLAYASPFNTRSEELCIFHTCRRVRHLLRLRHLLRKCSRPQRTPSPATPAPRGP